MTRAVAYENNEQLRAVLRKVRTRYLKHRSPRRERSFRPRKANWPVLPTPLLFDDVSDPATE